MKDFFKDILADNTTKFGFLTSLAITILAVLLVLLNYRGLPPFLPLFNQLSWGEKRLGATIQIFIPILIVFGIFLSNLIAAPFFYKKIPLISRLLAIVSFISAILVFLFLIKTIQLVI